MILKSYFVHSLDEAIRMAKHDLGSDALLVESKQLPNGPGNRARLEVVFACEAAAPPPPVGGPPEGAGRAEGPNLRMLHNELRLLSRALSLKPGQFDLGDTSLECAITERLRGRLLEGDVPERLTDTLIARWKPALRAGILAGDTYGEALAQNLLIAEWPSSPGTTSSIRHAESPHHIFFGPPGSGKTSTVAKLAFRIAILERRPVQVLSIDDLRIGGTDQLAHLCALIGVPFLAVESGQQLITNLAATGAGRISLIDTPGYGSADIDLSRSLASQLRNVTGLERHFVIPATLRTSEAMRMQSLYQHFQATQLLFTHMDESRCVGPLLALSLESNTGLSWLGTGTRIPEDLERPDLVDLSNRLMTGQHVEKPEFESLCEGYGNLASAAAASSHI